MAQNLAIKVMGLFTNPSPMLAPAGTMEDCQDVVIDRPSVLQSRRGMNRYGNVFGSDLKKTFVYSDRVLVQSGSTLYRDSDGAGTWTSYSGTFTEAGSFLRSASAGGSIFFTTSTGIRKIDTLAGTPYDAGVPRAINGTAAIDGASGFLSNNKKVAYRVVWTRKDAQGRFIVGYPSERFFVANTSGGDKKVAITIYVPSGITTSHFWQLYRSEIVDHMAEPSDDMKLVAQAYYTSGPTVPWTDEAPDAVREIELYTNDTQQGIQLANAVPPFAKEIEVYKNRTWFANTKTRQYLYLSLIGTDFVANNTITFTDGAGVTLFTITAKAAENVAAGEFLFTVGSIQSTVESIVRVVNGYASNTVIYAYDESNYTTAPGKIRFECRSISTAAFAVKASANGDVWIPELPTSGVTILSTNDEVGNRLFFSNINEYEGVPVAQYVDLGSAEYPIQRLVALRDSLYAFKRDGLFRIFGDVVDSTDFRVVKIDSSLYLAGEDTPAVFNNTIYACTNQGVVKITDSGLDLVSDPIDDQILPRQSTNYPGFVNSFGIGYESERKYLLFFPLNTTDTYPTAAFVYHQDSNQWTKWLISARSGVVNQDNDKLYLAYSEKYVRQERKALDSSDYIDYSFSVTIASVTNTTTVVLSSATGVAVNHILVQGNNRSIITGVSGNTLTLEDAGNWEAGSATVGEPITQRVVFNPITYGDPSIMKQAHSFEGVFSATDFRQLSFGFKTDLSPYEELTEMQPLEGDGWGEAPWGTEPWGGIYGGAGTIRTFVHREKQWHHWIQPIIENTDAITDWGILGFAIQYEPISEVLKT